MFSCLQILEAFLCFVLFFSSRRRHTRYIGDWSSDVCSSDLASDVRAPVATSRPGQDTISTHHTSSLPNKSDTSTPNTAEETPLCMTVSHILSRPNRSEERRVGKARGTDCTPASDIEQEADTR